MADGFWDDWQIAGISEFQISACLGGQRLVWMAPSVGEGLILARLVGVLEDKITQAYRIRAPKIERALKWQLFDGDGAGLFRAVGKEGAAWLAEQVEVAKVGTARAGVHVIA